MYSLSDVHGEFIGFFDTDTDALEYAIDNGVAGPFRIAGI